MNTRLKNTYSKIKTIVDYSIALFLLASLTPVIIILIIIIKITSKGPVLYCQNRIGKHGKPFLLYKFRSMYHGTDGGVPLLSGRNDVRITKFGRFMRKHKFDEIPNFINVLKGEMSLVGPRPEQQYFIDQIYLRAPQYKTLHSVKPGITSWGQVKYGYATNAEQMIERMKYDIYYLEKISPWFDLKIALYTVGIIVKGKGV